MLSLYEILKASKTGISPDLWTALAGKNWSGSDSGHEIKELTGVPPLSFRADGTPLLDFLISGNMEQTGTPTPQNPIEPSECGERTGNLIDVNVSESGGISDTGELINNPNTWRSTVYYDIDTTLNYVMSKAKQTIRINYYDASKNHISREGVTQDTYKQLTIPSNARYFKWTLYDSNGIPDIQAARSIEPMVNVGTTPLPYEPYGFKIPILSGGTTTPVYLGEVESTRRVKKQVVTISRIIESETPNMKIAVVALDTSLVSPRTALSTVVPYGNASTPETFYFINANNIGMVGAVGDTDEQITAKYEGSILYYGIAETTGIVNEPIRKIGGYADTLSMEQAGVSIPTLNGQTVVDVDTTLKPSEMYIKYQK